MSESDTNLPEVLEALRAHPRVAWAERQNTGGAYLGEEANRQYVAFGREGNADITGQLVDGRRLEVEVKRAGEWPSDETFARWQRGEGYQGRVFKLTRTIRRLLAQRAFLELVTRWGGVAFVAVSRGDVHAELGEPAQASLEGLEPARALELSRYGRKRRKRRGRWQELPEGVKGEEQ